jgi:uncharacterized protein (DUF488 family)
MEEIYTIGHSNMKIEKFLGLLKRYGIETLVDIRSVPFSRFNPQFNRKALAAVLAESGIKYVFEGERLGGRIRDVDCYYDKKLPDKKTNPADAVDFSALEKKAWFAEGIRDLIGIGAESRTAIMCSEEDPEKCHRKKLVGRKLEMMGARVAHVRSKLPAANPEDGLF